MQSMFCYTGSYNQQAAEAILQYSPETEFVETIGLFGYNEAILKRWGNDDLVVIEGDKVITAGVMPSFAKCPEPWCCYSYYNFPDPWRREVSTGLGCTKYSLEFQRTFHPRDFLFGDHPDWPPCRDCGGLGCWKNLDVRISRLALTNGVEYHKHGMVDHLHEYKDNSWMKDMDFGTQFAGPLWAGPPPDIERYLEIARRMGWRADGLQSR